MSKIRVVTTKKDIPEDTVSHKGFHLLNMGKEGMWLVDEEHPGYKGCVKKAIKLNKEQPVIKLNKEQPVIKLAPEAKEIADNLDKKGK